MVQPWGRGWVLGTGREWGARSDWFQRIMEDLVSELLPQLEEHAVREDAGDGQVARARVAHHELHPAHQRDVLGVLLREGRLPSVRRGWLSDMGAKTQCDMCVYPELEGVVVRARQVPGDQL